MGTVLSSKRPAEFILHRRTAIIFVDILPLDGEFQEDFRRRREELEDTLHQLEGEGVKVVVRARK